MKKPAHFFIILALVTACESVPTDGDGEKQFYAEKKTDDLRIELDIKSHQINSLQDIEADYILTNISDQTLNYEFSSSCQIAFTISDLQNNILDSRKNIACAAVLTELNLKPGETKVSTIAPKSLDINRELDDGIYMLSAFLMDDNGAKISALFKVQ